MRNRQLRGHRHGRQPDADRPRPDRARRNPGDPAGSRGRRHRAAVDCDLYVTLEPCTMCAGAISFARIGGFITAPPIPRAAPWIRGAVLCPADLPSRAGGLFGRRRDRGGDAAQGIFQGEAVGALLPSTLLSSSALCAIAHWADDQYSRDAIIDREGARTGYPPSRVHELVSPCHRKNPQQFPVTSGSLRQKMPGSTGASLTLVAHFFHVSSGVVAAPNAGISPRGQHRDGDLLAGVEIFLSIS